MRDSNKKWFQAPIYTRKLYFKNASECIERKCGRGKFSIQELLEKISPKNNNLKHTMRLSNVPRSLIHYGRKGDTIDRDYMFYIYAQNFMREHSSSNTLFINYTGHSGPVAAALAEHNIPTYWQMDLSEDNIAEDRILGQIQDYINIITKNENTNNSNLALMLEPPHSFIPTVIQSALPSIEALKLQKIRKIVIFTEDPFGEETNECPNSDTFFLGIKSFVDKLTQSGFEIEFVGLDCKDKSQQNSDFICPDKEKIVDLSEYEQNFDVATIEATEPFTMDRREEETISISELLKKALASSISRHAIDEEEKEDDDHSNEK